MPLGSRADGLAEPVRVEWFGCFYIRYITGWIRDGCKRVERCATQSDPEGVDEPWFFAETALSQPIDEIVLNIAMVPKVSELDELVPGGVFRSPKSFRESPVASSSKHDFISQESQDGSQIRKIRKTELWARRAVSEHLSHMMKHEADGSSHRMFDQSAQHLPQLADMGSELLDAHPSGPEYRD